MADVTTPFGFPYPEPTDLVRDGATDIEALAQAANDQFAAGFQFAGQRIYTSSGVFVKADPLGTGDIGLRAIRVRMVGGGGGSGGTAATGASQVAMAGGGGGGGFAVKFITDITGLASSETVIRGAGGTGGAPGPNPGSVGGTSSAFGVSATGGLTSSGANPFPLASQIASAPGNGGGGSGGDLHVRGDAGHTAVAVSTVRVTTSKGGVSAFGGSSRSRLVISLAGESPQSDSFGAGANGASASESISALAGAAGANGIVIIDCFV